MLFFSYLSLLLVLVNPSEDNHAVYISVVEIEASQIRVKVFSDDLRDAIRSHAGIVPDSSVVHYCSKYQKEINQYFSEKLTLVINEKEIPFQFHTASDEGESYWISFGFSMEEEWKSMQVEDKHFMEMFPGQSNIIKVNWPDSRFGRLNASETSCSFEF
ncbi:MAG: DUF6702 family protein [Cytophagales bacterium]|nr:DUF6702 family protein [Cytophagales bacterium]